MPPMSAHYLWLKALHIFVAVVSLGASAGFGIVLEFYGNDPTHGSFVLRIIGRMTVDTGPLDRGRCHPGMVTLGHSKATELACQRGARFCAVRARRHNQPGLWRYVRACRRRYPLPNGVQTVKLVPPNLTGTFPPRRDAQLN